MFSDIKYLFFDLGSTLLDESDCDKAVISYSIDGSAIGFDTFVSSMKHHASRNRPAYKSTLMDFGLPKAKWDSSLEKLYPDTLKVLDCLSKKYHLAVVANQLPGATERLARFGILPYFDFIVSSAEFGKAKPAPDIFIEALALAGCSPKEAVMIGDRLDNDIEPAQKLGMKSIWVKQDFGGLGDPKLLSKMPDAIVNDISELIDLF